VLALGWRNIAISLIIMLRKKKVSVLSKLELGGVDGLLETTFQEAVNMNWKLLVAFICAQAAGIVCVFVDYRLSIGWWLLLFPGSFAVFLFHPFEGISAAIVAVAVSANAIIWYSVSGLVNLLKR
jgi:hypothetical protein